MGGWVLFRCDTLAHAIEFFRALGGFSRGDPRTSSASRNILDPLVAVTLAVGILFATPLAQRIGAWRDRAAARPGLAPAAALGADVAWLVVVGVSASAFLAAGTYNPFIYFRF